MTYEEAKQQAIAMGALKPQTLKEKMSAGWMANQGYRYYADTPYAQSKLEAWAQGIMRGEDPRKWR
jgi:hypothetical protein